MDYEMYDVDMLYKGTVTMNNDDTTLIFSAGKVGVCATNLDGKEFYQEIPFTAFPELEVLCDLIENLCDEVQSAENELSEEPDEDEMDEEEFEWKMEEYEKEKEELYDLQGENEEYAITMCKEFLEEHLEKLMSFVTIVTL